MIFPEVLLPTQRYQAIIALPNMFNWPKFIANEMLPGRCSANGRKASGHNGGAGEQPRRYLSIVSPVREMATVMTILGRYLHHQVTLTTLVST